VTTGPARRAYIAWVLVCLVWGTTYLAIRITLDTIPPFLLAAIRWTAAGTLLIGFFAARGEALPARREWPALVLLGILMIGFGNGAVVWAQQTVPSGLASVFVAAAPFWMIAVEQFAPAGDRITWRKLLGLTIGFCGIVLLVWPQLHVPSGRGFVAGFVSTQVACLGWAVGSSYSRRRPAAENVLTSVALQMLFAGACLFAIALMRGEWRALSFDGRTTGALAYLVLVGSLVGFTAYAYALKHLPVATVSLYAYVNPVIAVLLGTVVLDEPLNPRIALASAIVLAGAMLTKRG
jgi:drug/metabolite transporter (DMT)-like permease